MGEYLNMCGQNVKIGASVAQSLGLAKQLLDTISGYGTLRRDKIRSLVSRYDFIEALVTNMVQYKVAAINAALGSDGKHADEDVAISAGGGVGGGAGSGAGAGGAEDASGVAAANLDAINQAQVTAYAAATPAREVNRTEFVGSEPHLEVVRKQLDFFRYHNTHTHNHTLIRRTSHSWRYAHHPSHLHDVNTGAATY